MVYFNPDVAGSAGATGTRAPATTTTTGATSAPPLGSELGTDRATLAAPVSNEFLEAQYDKARAEFVEITGENPPASRRDGKGFNQKLEKARSGGYTNAELEEVFGFEITDEAWKAFTGGKETIEDIAELIFLLREFKKFQKLTGTVFKYFVQCTKITPIKVEKLEEVLLGLDDSQRAEFVRRHETPLKNALSYILKTNYDEETTLADLLEAVNGLDAKERQQLCAYLFKEMYDAIEDHAPVKAALKDDLVADRAAQTLFKAYLIKGEGVTREALDELKAFSDRVAGLRRYLGKNADTALAGIDSDAEATDPETGRKIRLDSILSSYRTDGKDKTIKRLALLKAASVASRQTADIAAAPTAPEGPPAAP